jgi:hypothetical protein
MKPALGNGTCVVPLGDVEIVLLDQGLDGAAKQRRVVARHRRYEQHLGVVALATGLPVAVEMAKLAERRGPDDLLAHRRRQADHPGMGDAPVGLVVAPADAAEDLA